MVARETSISDGLVRLGLSARQEGVRRLVRYAEILEQEALPLGFLGPKEGPRIVPRHVLESCALIPLLPSDGSIIDVGAGPGLPGVPIACLYDGTVTLLESNHRRADFLRRIVRELGLSADVVEGRAEEIARTELREHFGAAVSRALAAPATALELCLPFVAVGGRMVSLVTPGVPDRVPPSDAERDNGDDGLGADASKPAAVDERIGTLADVQRLASISVTLGGGAPELEPLEVPGADASRWAMIVPKVDPTPDRFPRRTGVPARRPLG